MHAAIRPVESMVRVQTTALATAGSRAPAVAIGIPGTPTGGDVQVFVNSAAIAVGADANTSAAYFSGDGGATARVPGTTGAIAPGDVLFWNGIAAGYQLGTTDSVMFIFTT